MAYAATVIPVMIASPSDVSAERDIIRAAIHDWNDVNGASSKIMLTAVGWETHSSPELGTRPQDLINSRLLGDCDLLVGVFWTRLGTPTGEAASGSVEEIERHVNAGRPAMIYFSSQPIAPDSIDPGQYAALKQFKATCRKQGLIEEYANLDEFRAKLAKQLQAALNNSPYLSSIIESHSKAPSVDVVSTGGEADAIQLSDEAAELLRAAAATKDGSIYKLKYLGGASIRAGEAVFGTSLGRERARWDAALEELVQLELVAPVGYKGEIFEMTHRGWQVVDAL